MLISLGHLLHTPSSTSIASLIPGSPLISQGSSSQQLKSVPGDSSALASWLYNDSISSCPSRGPGKAIPGLLHIFPWMSTHNRLGNFQLTLSDLGLLLESGPTIYLGLEPGTQSYPGSQSEAAGRMPPSMLLISLPFSSTHKVQGKALLPNHIFPPLLGNTSTPLCTKDFYET